MFDASHIVRKPWKLDCHISSLRMKSGLSTKIRTSFITIQWQPVWLKIGAHPSVIWNDVSMIKKKKSCNYKV